MSEETNDRRPNAVWPILLVLLLSPAAVFVVSLISIVLAAAFSFRGSGASFPAHLEDWMPAHSGTLTGVLVLIVPAQATVLFIAYASSRTGPLGFTRWSASGKTIALAVLGTLGIQWACATAFQLLGVEPSKHIREMWKLLAVPGAGASLFVGVLVSLTPAICEEALFRGVGQQRLLERWPPLAAIGAASAFFAFSHMDVQQGIMVFPLGLWFGYVAWRASSARASALCHAANNAFAIVVGRIWGDPDTGNLPLGWPFVAAGILLCACTALAARSLARDAAPAR